MVVWFSMNSLYFGDNLNILREHLPSESVDLIYLDPPFNSKRDYNLLFKSPKGHDSDAQITAFEDSWHWGEQAEREFKDLLRQPNTMVAEMMQALRKFLGENDMMANRLLELHRVLKPTGSLYLHCDPTASHYLKVVLDGVFGKENFRNEITWKRQSAHNDATTKFAAVTDIILFYHKTKNSRFKVVRVPLDAEYVEKQYRHHDGEGRLYRLDNLRSPNPRPNLTYDYKGYQPHPNGWAVSKKRMEELDAQGRLHFPKNPDGRIALKRYLDENEGAAVSNLWDDILPLHGSASEILGYPTQKPLALLERIIQASSNEGDVVLDPFCGCGTAVHAAEKLKRKWIGIDITHLAIHLIERRMKSAFPDHTFAVHGTPKDIGGARDLAARDKYEFQNWACSLVDAQPYRGGKKGADSGIDGQLYFDDDKKTSKRIIVSVKGGENVNVAMIRDLKGVMEREKVEITFFITLTEPTKPMVTEAASAGFYSSPMGRDYPKLQILTIEGLLNGKDQPRYPDLTLGGLTFKDAKKERKEKQSNLFLP